MDTRKRKEAGEQLDTWIQEYGHSWVQWSLLRDGNLWAGMHLSKAKSILETMATNEEEHRQVDRHWTGSQKMSSFFLYWLHCGLALPLSFHHGAYHHLIYYFSLLIYLTKEARVFVCLFVFLSVWFTDISPTLNLRVLGICWMNTWTYIALTGDFPQLSWGGGWATSYEILANLIQSMYLWYGFGQSISLQIKVRVWGTRPASSCFSFFFLETFLQNENLV